MRFLLFSAQYLPTVGGVERYTHNLAKTLVSLGHHAVVATSALPGLPENEVSEEGIHVYRLPSHLFMNGRFPVPKNSKAFRSAAESVWAQEYDFCLVNTRFYPLALWAVRQCRKRGVRFLVLDHSTGYMRMGNILANVAGHMYERLAMWYLKKRAPMYGVSEACVNWLRHLGAKPRGVLYNAVDPAQLEDMGKASSKDFRKSTALEEDTPLIAFSGRFIPEKGIWELAAGFALLKEKMPDAALIMAGDGPEWAKMAREAPPGVFCPGSLPHEDNMALLAQADVFCLPTRYAEGFPTALLEAAAVGTLPVATPAGGAPELIDDGKSGILLKDTSPETISSALYKALSDGEWRQQARLLAQHKVETRFTWAKTAEKLVSIAAMQAEKDMEA